MKSVAIIGGGVGGLSAAHELSKLNKYKIDIYEKKDAIGGMARSGRDADGCETEYCWRVFFGFYDNLFKILKDVPLINNKNKTPLNNMTTYKHLNFTDTKIPLLDYLRVVYVTLYGLTSSDKRMDKLDNLSWWKAIGVNKSSNMFREIGEWLGMDRYKGSYNSVIRVGMEMQIVPARLYSGYADYVTTKPTSEAVFDHWHKYLEDNGVSIHLNSQITDIILNNHRIESVKINGQIIDADYYIFAVPVEVLNNLINKNPSPMLKYIGDFKNIQKLKDDCLHMQLSFQVYFDRPISIGCKNQKKGKDCGNAFMVVDSPWDLIVLQYDKIYKNVKLCKNIPAKGGWSIAVCTAYIPGILYNKPFNQCTYEEIKEEIWAQLMNSQELRKEIRKNNNFDLSKDMIVHWSPMWPTFRFKDGKVQTTEPKFTNNIGNIALRPSFKTPLDNMYISTAYIKETIDIFSMEAACIAGKRVAKDIAGREGLNNNIDPTIWPRPFVFYPFRKIDEVSYGLGLPNMSFVILMFIAVIFMLIVVYGTKNLNY